MWTNEIACRQGRESKKSGAAGLTGGSFQIQIFFSVHLFFSKFPIMFFAKKGDMVRS